MLEEILGWCIVIKIADKKVQLGGRQRFVRCTILGVSFCSYFR